MKPSIRRRLLLILLSVTGIVWGLAALGAYLDARHEVTELFDAQLAQSARNLLVLSRHELEELQHGAVPAGTHVHFIPEELGTLEGHEYEHKVAYQVWHVADESLVVRSDTAPTERLTGAAGFSDRVINGGRWRVFSMTDPSSGFNVQLGEHYGIRQELADKIALRLSTPILLALPVLAVLIGVGVGGALKPLTRLADAIGRRAPDRLDPVDDKKVPAEALPLVQALNRLLGRVSGALDNERRFTADAAHELRTPLAALKTQAQVAQRSDNPAVRRQAIAQVVRGVDRATHLVDELLALARLDPDEGTLRKERVDLCSISVNVMAELAQLGTEQGVDMELVEPCSGSAEADPDLVKLIVRNLVDNGLRYTQKGGRVEVEVFVIDGRACLRVHDSGKGIPPKRRHKVFERFHRGDQASGGGCGLGLSIVKRVTELHSGRIRLGESKLGGLLVEVCLPECKTRT